MFQARQGDIFFVAVKKKPNSKTLKLRKNATIAYGEVTGHAHKITSPPIEDMDSFVDENGDIFVRSSVPIVVGHEEHSGVTLPANVWIRITRQREYDPMAAEKQRKVAD
jgi:hypothetical protein